MFRLKPIDIVVLKKLSDVVNVVPVIAKSDSLTLAERQAFKQRVHLPLVTHLITRSKLNSHFTISKCIPMTMMNSTKKNAL
jgi:septin family protein